MSKQRANVRLLLTPDAQQRHRAAPRRVDLRRTGTLRLLAVIGFSRAHSTHSHNYSFYTINA